MPAISATRANRMSWSALDGPARRRRRGKEANAQWIITHLIEEHARHLDHMDLLREATDERAGY